MTSSESADQVNYATTALTLLILLARITLWLLRKERIDTSFFLVVASVAVVVARVVANAFYLKYGSAADVIKHGGYFNEEDLPDIITGSVLVLVARVLITTILWLQICILLLFYTRITYLVNWVAWVVKLAWITVAITFIGNISLVFLECRPISLYWQVTPDPGTCVQAYGQLLNQTISNTILDILLIIIAYPIVGLKKRTVTEHITLYTLFALGTFCIIISVIRVVSVHDSGSSQATRSLWASVQMLVSTFVANAPNIYGSVRALRVKKQNANSAPGPTYGLSTLRKNRARHGLDETWLKMDDNDYFALAPNSPSYIRPLPPATTFYDDQTAPAPYSHQPSLEEGIYGGGEPSRSHIRTASSRVNLIETTPPHEIPRSTSAAF
ncbi:hypothetical protein F4803DRAFT_126011 [Xylaria telfairii]|nr:hypothetical protein F4803DRAFT_126011 [Xylaria telfairii]